MGDLVVIMHREGSVRNFCTGGAKDFLHSSIKGDDGPWDEVFFEEGNQGFMFRTYNVGMAEKVFGGGEEGRIGEI